MRINSTWSLYARRIPRQAPTATQKHVHRRSADGSADAHAREALAGHGDVCNQIPNAVAPAAPVGGVHARPSDAPTELAQATQETTWVLTRSVTHTRKPIKTAQKHTHTQGSIFAYNRGQSTSHRTDVRECASANHTHNKQSQKEVHCTDHARTVRPRIASLAPINRPTVSRMLTISFANAEIHIMALSSYTAAQEMSCKSSVDMSHCLQPYDMAAMIISMESTLMHIDTFAVQHCSPRQPPWVSRHCT